MACALDQNVRPVAFLVNDTGKGTIVAIPGGGRLPAEALNASKSGILRFYQYFELRTNQCMSVTWITTKTAQ